MSPTARPVRVRPAAVLTSILAAACGGPLTTAPTAAPPAAPAAAPAAALTPSSPGAPAAPRTDAAARAGAAHAAATLRDAAGAEIGTAHFIEDAAGRVHLTVHVRGVAPGRHGLHLHAVGVCAVGAGAPFASAGVHHNPAGREHGRQNPQGHHAGDLPNVEVNAAGVGHLAAVADASLAALADADGTALVLHQHPDDERTNSGPLGPGNSGPRLACGVLTAR
jgi:Cu-Zn family superoxide dismutase